MYSVPDSDADNDRVNGNELSPCSLQVPSLPGPVS